MKYLLLSMIMLAGVLSVMAQFPMTEEQQREDFQIFKNSIQDIHPGLYWYYDSATIERRFEKIEANLGNGELRDFYKVLLEFYANLGCGHSWLSAPSRWRNFIDQGPYRLPIDLYFEQNQAYITKDLTRDSLFARGTKVKSINGEDPPVSLKKMMVYAPSDGYNQTHRKAIITWNFDRYYQTIVKTDSIFELEVEYEGSAKTVELKGIPKAAADSIRDARYPADPWEDFLQYKNLDGIGYIKIGSFSTGWIKNRGQNYKRFLKETFGKLKEESTSKLIIDIRGNGGGDDDAGSLLCQYLINQEFGYFDRMEAVTKKFKYKEYSNTKWINLLAGLVLHKDRNKPGYYIFNKSKGLKVQKPKEEVFEGDLVLLTDGSTFSTSADVAAILHANERATFIGEEVGGGYYGNNSAVMYDITLPNSKITYYIPVIRYYSSVDYEPYYGYGVKPDIEIEASIQSVLAGEHELLGRAVQFLSE